MSIREIADELLEDPNSAFKWSVSVTAGGLGAFIGATSGGILGAVVGAAIGFYLLFPVLVYALAIGLKCLSLLVEYPLIIVGVCVFLAAGMSLGGRGGSQPDTWKSLWGAIKTLAGIVLASCAIGLAVVFGIMIWLRRKGRW